MCGIAGIIRLSKQTEANEIKKSIRKMIDIQAHRGPFDEGEWITDIGNYCLAVGHCRLSIIDLSHAGHQPMVSSCGQYILTYNGELYNYLELRIELQKKGYSFHTNTDTEVVLQGLIHWGEKAFEHFNGMWALALIDLKKRKLLLSRDRFGEKPLYYYGNKNAFYFSSEIKAICEASRDSFVPNAAVVARFLGQSLLNAQDETFFKGINQVPAASYMVVSLSGSQSLELDAPKYYWSYLRSGLSNLKEDELVEEISSIFIDSVRIRLRSDVPVGVLLSGGLDSSAIASAMLQSNPGGKINILSVVSDDPKYDEQLYIDIMARHLGQEVHKIRLNPDPGDAFQLLNKAIWHNDEPVGGFSAVAHMLLMEKAKELGITVILSGQGGDELLCGYLKYQGFYLKSLLRSLRIMKFGKAFADILKPPSAYFSDFKLSDAKRYLPISLQRHPDEVFGEAFRNIHWVLDIGLGNGSLQERQALDMQRFSVPSLTHYEDRMSMAFSREMRLPFLDHRLAELLLPLEPELKLRSGWTKWIFRKSMSGLLPQSIAWRTDKKGFSNPAGEWLKGEWRESVREIFSEKMKTEELGLINRSKLQKLFLEYCEGKNRWLSEKDIFNPLSLEIWARQYQSHLA